MMSKILVDSSFLIALYDKDADIHEEGQELSQLYQSLLLVPQVVLTEGVYIIKRETGVNGASLFLEEFTDSNPGLQEIIMTDLKRAREIMQQYATAKFDFVDCCIMALSERLNITQVFTIDQRDFSIFRPKHCNHLEIFP